MLPLFITFATHMSLLSLKDNDLYPIDDPRRTLQHKQIILDKKFLKNLYQEWYAVFVNAAKTLPKGKLVELGSGGGFLKELLPQVVTSDVLELPGLDLIFYAEKMPFENAELSGIFMVDVLHHIPDNEAFLKEAVRVLKPRGKIIMNEPANSVWGRFIYRNFHHEPFEPTSDWSIPSSGPMSGANGALPWIIFERDRKIFEQKFPELKINYIKYHSPLRYLISGGVSKKQLAPNFSFGIFSGLDKVLSSLSPQISMFVTIELERK